ncbi:hypothetical protein CDCA_CDCA18G4587 [Cyanidium caldarium]|uniref:Thiaminase-2/PQQC domain-containing protein n=1 Tax=Cyanidium caldarium TaxID=2771 RepID=A0AAV9J1T1_CYACA|nr:hypothetical protein CDCA_CDCA18G4587 [Cyanidium caldarium]
MYLDTTEPSTGHSRRLWLHSAGQFDRVLQTPFLRSLSEGTLDRHLFTVFVESDREFLLSYVRCLNLLAYASDEWDECRVLQELVAGIFAELEAVHDARPGGRDVALAGAALQAETSLREVVRDYRACIEAGAATLARDMWAAQVGPVAGAGSPRSSHTAAVYASRRARLFLLALLLPCMALYARIGTALQPRLTSTSTTAAKAPSMPPAYRDWIATYAGDAFQLRAWGMEALLDKWVESLCTEYEQDVHQVDEWLACDAYAVALDHEVRLFAAASHET